MVHEKLLIGAAARPFPGQHVNGDAWQVYPAGERTRVAVIDGLGHGVEASEAACLALEVIGKSHHLSLTDCLIRCNEELRQTRGAAVSIAEIDAAGSELVYAGIGNVEARVWYERREHRLISRRGVVGAAIPKVHPQTVPLCTSWVLVLHTDGVSARFVIGDEVAGMEEPNVQALADQILARWGRATDDGTVVVVASADTASG